MVFAFAVDRALQETRHHTGHHVAQEIDGSI